VAKVDAEVEVDAAELNGRAIVGGPFVAGQLSVAGALESRGPLTVSGLFALRGALEASADVRAGEARLEGRLRTRGELVVERTLRLRGTFQGPSVRSAALELQGSATIPGTVDAATVTAALTEDSAIGTVRCGSLRLRGPPPNLVRRVLGRVPVVTVERVEAETVFIEAARVGFVRAQEVTLGREAHVAAVEGRVVRSHRSARLGPESWSRPPAGLTR